MDPFNNTKVISPATYLIAGAALLLAGAIIGVFTDPYLPSSLSNAKKEYQAGFTAARTLVENSSFGAIFKTPDDVWALVGTVTSIDGGKLTLHIPSVNPFADQTLGDRTVTFNTSTKIVNRIEKEPSMYQISVATSTISVATSTKITQVATTSPKIFPVEYVSIPASISDIKVGDTVNVLASENVKTLKEFTASEVQILSKTPVL